MFTGEKRSTLSFLHCIVDDANNIVGYAFKSSEPITIPVLDFDILESESDMVFNDKAVQSDGVFYLNIYEMANLVTRKEYSGVVSGNGTIARFCYKRVDGKLVPVLLMDDCDIMANFSNLYDSNGELKGEYKDFKICEVQ